MQAKHQHNQWGMFMNIFSNLMGLLISSGTGPLGHNFRTYGTSFHAHDYNEFAALARKFYNDAMAAEGDPAYTSVKMSGKRIAIDYKGEVRGVYDRYGRPIAFFRPNFVDFGYTSKEKELADFRAGENAAFT